MGTPKEKVSKDLIQVLTVSGNQADERFFLVSSSLNEKEREQMTQFLRDNIDVFPWQPYDMPNIDADVMCHRLHIDPNFKPIKQKPGKTTPKKS